MLSGIAIFNIFRGLFAKFFFLSFFTLFFSIFLICIFLKNRRFSIKLYVLIFILGILDFYLSLIYLMKAF